MVVVTGGAGFIGSCLIQKLNEEGFKAVVVVDNFDRDDKMMNLKGKQLRQKVDRTHFYDWLDHNFGEVEFIFHLGARTDTAEFDKELLWSLNTDYSKGIWSRCVRYQIPLVYASSAATYGMGERGFDDDESRIDQLQPLNAYGESKNEFDKWVLCQKEKPFYWAGLKFFNVFGPNEYHKSRMASVVLHSYKQIKETGGMKLFRSHNSEYADGAQLRDFVYVKDVIKVCYYLMRQRKNSGIYNLGTGKARSFLDLTKAVFGAMAMDEQIQFIDTPVDIRKNYQYFTEAKMDKLKEIGYPDDFYSLEMGVEDYVKNYLSKGKYY